MSTVPSVSVAPMEGVSTFPLRLWLQMVATPTAMTSPFLRVTPSLLEEGLPPTFVPELIELRGTLPYDLVPQFIAAEPRQFLRAAELLPENLAPFIELNCGCPSPNSLGRYAGSGMLRDPEFFARSLEDLTRALGPGRLAVKMRLGMESDAEFPTLLEALADLPLARLTVHARTRADGYRGQARWAAIQVAAERTKFPVHASGDIWGLKSWLELLRVAPSIQGAMIGRGLLRNPWIFTEIKCGQRVRLSLLTFCNSLFCYLLLHELFLKDPGRLLQRVAKGRLGRYCGNDFACWEKVTVELTSLCFGYPFLLLRPDSLSARTTSPVAFQRLRLLWSYLRSSLPEAFAAPSLLRCKKPEEFFEQLLMHGQELANVEWEIGHQPAWDADFARQRG